MIKATRKNEKGKVQKAQREKENERGRAIKKKREKKKTREGKEREK